LAFFFLIQEKLKIPRRRSHVVVSRWKNGFFLSCRLTESDVRMPWGRSRLKMTKW